MQAERPTRPARLALLIAAFVVAALLWPTAAYSMTAHGVRTDSETTHGAGPSDQIAQLSQTGAFTSGSLLHGRTLVIDRGQTVQFRLAPSDVESSHHGKDRHGQITLDSAGLPGRGGSIRLSSNSAYRVTFTQPGAYSFHWQATAADQGLVLPPALSHLVQAVLNSLSDLQRWTGSVIVDAKAPGNAGSGQGTSAAQEGSAAQGASAAQGGSSALEDSAGSGGQHQPGTSAGPGSASAANPASVGSTTRSAGPAASSLATPRGVQTPATAASAPRPASVPKIHHEAAAPTATHVATYVFSGLLGFVILGILWMVWVASIRPILGR